MWDRETGKPVYNAIVWQDRRTAERCQQMKTDGTEETVRQKTGLLIDPYFSSTKIAWILDNVDGARQKAEAGKLAFGTVDSWLIWNLTSGKRTSPTGPTPRAPCSTTSSKTAGTTDLLKLFGIPESMMPEVVWSSEKIGQVTTSLGLEATEIAGIAGDQQSALFGQLCIQPGRCEEYLRHRLLPAAEHRRAVRPLGEAADHHAHLQPGQEAGICARRQHLHRRRGRAVAARQPAFIRHSSEVEAIGGYGRRLGRRRPGARLRRPGRAILGPVRDRPLDWAAPRHQARPHRPGSARRASPSRWPM